MADANDPSAWLAKADHDLLAIENNIAAKRVPWDVVCYHAQQVAEKALKAYLVATGTTPPKTHDLTVLLTQCVQSGADDGFRNAAKRAKLPPGLTQHDLRHPRVTMWLAEGKSPVLVKEAVGHSDIRTTMGYTHLAKEHLRALVDSPPIRRQIEAAS